LLYHSECVGLEIIDIVGIETYVCKKCNAQTGELTSWKQRQPNVSKKAEKEKYYFEVERISGHQILADRKYLFRIKWKGYKKQSIKLEENLDRYLDILQEYCLEHQLPRSELLGYYGHNDDGIQNRRNWITIEQMIKTYQKFERYVYGAETISVLEWSRELPASDSIIVLPYTFHIYLCLYYARRQLCFIADDSNMFNSRYEVNAGLRKLIKCNMIGCFFDQQTKLDYCGSPAVLISLELKRAYFSLKLPLELAAPKRNVERVTAELHHFESNGLEKPLHEIRRKLKCVKCLKGFMRNHRRRCIEGWRMNANVVDQRTSKKLIIFGSDAGTNRARSKSNVSNMVGIAEDT